MFLNKSIKDSNIFPSYKLKFYSNTGRYLMSYMLRFYDTDNFLTIFNAHW